MENVAVFSLAARFLEKDPWMKTENITIRTAGPDDLDAINQQHCLPRGEILRKIENDEILLLIVDGVPAGQLRITFLWSQVPIIELIYIDRNFRKRGYSHAILGTLESHLRRRGCEVLYSSSQVDEPEPQAWHRHMGFEVCGMIDGLNEGGIGEMFFRKAL